MSDQVVRIIIQEAGAAQAAASVQSIAPAAEAAATGVDTLKSSMLQLQGALAAAGLVLGIQQILGLGEAYQNTVQKLRNNATSAEDLANKEKKLFEIAMQTRQGLDDLAKTYTGMDKAVKAMGGTSDETMKITENLAKAMTASGKDAEEVGGAIKRLGLAFATGHADARTFQVLFMQFPELANLVAKNISGVDGDLGKLRTGLMNGTISAQQMLNAMRDMGGAGSELEKKFARVEITVKGAWTNMGTALERYFGQSDQAWGVTAKLAETIDFVAHHVELAMPLVTGLGVAIALLGVKMIGTSVAATGLATAIGANKWALIVGVVVALGGLFINLAEKIKLTADGSVTAMGVIVGAWNLLKTAVSAALGFVTQFINALTGANLDATAVAVYALGTAFAVLAASQIVGFLRTITATVWAATPAFLAWALSVGAVVAEVAIFVATIAAMTFAIASFTDAIGLTRGAVENLKTVVSGTGNYIKETFNKAVTEATTAVNKGALANKEYSGTFKDTQAKSGAAAGEINNYKAAIDSLNKSYDAAIQHEEQWREGELKKTEAEFDSSNKKILEYAKSHDALGRAIDTTSEKTGAATRATYDYTGAMEASKSAVATTAQSNMQWYDTWTTQAEHDLDQLIAKQNEAATAARTAASPPGSLGGGFRTPLGDMEAKVALLQAKQDLATAQKELQDAGMDELKKARAQLDLAKAQAEYARAIQNAPQGPIPTIQKVGPITIETRSTGYYANGGEFTVGGSGGTDSQLVQFMASPKERVTITTPEQQSRAAQNPGIVIHMPIYAHDAASFAHPRTQRQITTQMEQTLRRVRTL